MIGDPSDTLNLTKELIYIVIYIYSSISGKAADCQDETREASAKRAIKY